MIRIMVADDQPIIRHGLRYVLELDIELKLVGEAENGIDLLEKLKETSCDVILMDIRMPLMDGVEATKQVKNNFPKMKVLILTTFEDEEYIFKALKNGADGYLLKDADPDELIHGIKSIVHGGMLLHPRVTAAVVSALGKAQNVSAGKEETFPESEEKNVKHLQLKNLTDRELEIAGLVMLGRTNREIAVELYLTEGTVKNHITKILDKLELDNRKQLMVYMTKVIGTQ